jgi:hypothetical protein
MAAVPRRLAVIEAAIAVWCVRVRVPHSCGAFVMIMQHMKLKQRRRNERCVMLDAENDDVEGYALATL